MIFFVRHGRTDYNDNFLMCGGDVDVPINETGKQQAKMTADLLKNEKIDLVYCSPLVRAKETCEAILKFHKGVKVVYDERLKEFIYGEINGKICFEHDEYIWRLDNKKYGSGAETLQHFYDRIKSFIDEVYPESKDKTILIVAHNGVGRVLKWIFYGPPKSGDLNEYDVKNCEILKFE